MAGKAKIGIIVGSLSDWPTMKRAADVLDELGIAYEAKVVSAHRTPKRLYEYAESAKARGLKVIIAGAGGAAHLPGMTAAMTALPVLGVPIASKALSGQDSLLSIVQMPAGVPVGTLGHRRAGRDQCRPARRADPGARRTRTSPNGSRPCAPGRRRRFRRRRRTMPEGGQRGPLPPGSTIGILGSGQLGRMLALAAARLGLKTHIYCEDSGPAFDVATRTTRAGFADPVALSAFAGKVDAVTYEFENVAVDTARHLAGLVPVRPGAKALEVAQDRLVEKRFIAALGIAVAPFRAIDGPEQIGPALSAFGAGHPQDAAPRL